MAGGSCGVASNAGRGPLYAARRTVRDQVAALRDGIDRSWLAPIQADVDKLRDIAALPDSGTRIAAAFAATAAPADENFAGIQDCRDLDEAVTRAFGWAQPDGMVLLSPAAPSFECVSPNCPVAWPGSPPPADAGADSR